MEKNLIIGIAIIILFILLIVYLMNNSQCKRKNDRDCSLPLHLTNQKKRRRKRNNSWIRRKV